MSKSNGTSKSFRVWVERLTTSDTVQKSHIDAFRNIVCPRADGDMYGRHTNLTQSEAQALVDFAELRFAQGGYKITAEHAAKGLAWLKSTGTSKRDGYGVPSECVDLFDHFMWVGVENFSSGYRSSYAPIYRIHLTDGRSIDYNTQAWQSGGRGVDWYWSTKFHA